jgi:hypothetical protein
MNLDEKVKKLLQEANAHLKQGRIKVAIECRDQFGSLYLRATLPPKPGSSKSFPHQQRIALRSEQGISLKITPVGIKHAEQQAKRLSADLMMGKFDWAVWLYDKEVEGDKQDSTHLSALLVQLWDKYAAFKAESLSQTTIGKDFRRIRNHLQELAKQDLDDAIAIQDYLQSHHQADSDAAQCLLQLGCETLSIESKPLRRYGSNDKSG